MNIPIIPIWVKLAALGAVVLAIASGGYYIKGVITDNKALHEQIDGFARQLEDEQEKNAKQDEIFAKRDELQQEVRSGVSDVTVRIKREAANDPQTRSFNDTVLPNGLRRAIIEANAAAAKCKGADCPHTD